MKKLQEEAKKLGINSFQKTKVELERLVAEKKDSPSASKIPTVRRTVEDNSLMEAEIRIRERRIEENYDPLTPVYKLHKRGKKPGWKYFWALNTPGRVQELQQLDYQIDESCETISAGDSMGGLQHIRMKKPLSIFKEDYERKQAPIKESETTLRRGDVRDGIREEDGAYGKITIGGKSVRLGSPEG